MKRHLLVGALLLVASGCAGWPKRMDSRGQAPYREQRAEDVIRDFEQRRDEAQYQAAIDRWRQGDATRAEAQLAALVARRPDFEEARLRLAEILWARNEMSAEQHFRAVVAGREASAEAHHGLGLMLDATGRREEALRHWQRAAALEPAHEAYRATLANFNAPPSGVARD